MKKPLEKPKFGLLERLSALLKGGVTLPDKAQRDGNFITTLRTSIDSVLLQRRLPFRNEDGSMNWSNFFAWNSGLARPVTRQDIFPEGVEGLTDRQVLHQVDDFISEHGLRGHKGHLFDPNEFPEVIDKDFRDLSAKINRLDFIRTIMSCSGHAEKTNGLINSFMEVAVDPDDPKTRLFHDQLKELAKRYSTDKIKIRVSETESVQPVVKNFWIDVNLLPPDSFQEKTGSLADDEEIIFIKIQGDRSFIRIARPGDEDYEQKRSDANLVSQHRRLKAWGHSVQCKAIRDQFWQDVSVIADSFTTSA